MPIRSLKEVLDLQRPDLETVRNAETDEEFYRLLLEYFREDADRLWYPPEPKNPDFEDQTAELCVKKKIPIREHLVDVSGGYDWVAAPAGDLENACVMTRMWFLANLGEAWWHTGDNRYAEEALAMFDDFITHVLPVENDMVNYWQIKRSGWRPLEIAIRLNGSWPKALQYLLTYPEFPARLWAWILYSVHQHAEYLMRYRWDHGNHAFTEAIALAAAGTRWPQMRDAEKWAHEGAGYLVDSFDEQHYPDGACTEMSLGYHRSVPSSSMALIRWLEYCGREDLLTDVFRQKVHEAVRAGMKTIKPDNTVAHFNDSQWADHSDFFLEGAEMFDDAELRYVGTHGQEGTLPSFTSVFLPNSRWVSMRTGWDEDDWHLIFDPGPVGIGHQNPNALSLEAYAFGRTLVTNTSAFRYRTSPQTPWHDFADYFQCQARANNCLTLEGQSQVLNDSQGDMVIHGDFDYAVGERRGFTDAPDVRHIRQVLFIKKRYWVIRDLVLSEEEQTPEVYWHLRPGGWSFDAGEAVLKSSYDGGGEVTVAMACEGGLDARVYEGQEDPINGWYSGHIGVKHPAAAMMACRSGSCPLSFETLIQPGRDEAPDADIERLATHDNAVTVAIHSDGATNAALFSPPDSGDYQLGALTTDAECLWADSAQKPHEIIACGASRVLLDGRIILECDRRVRGVRLVREGEGYTLSLADGPQHITSEFSLTLA
ncbi:MAG: heparinase II/III family protein [Armatimonadota bacterium]